MDQQKIDKSLEIKFCNSEKSVKKFSFAFAKQKVEELLDFKGPQNIVAQFDAETELAEKKAERAGSSPSEPLRVHSTAAATLYVNAKILFENGELSLAANLLRELLSLDPNSQEASLLLIRVLKQTEKWEEAELCCRELLKKSKTHQVTKWLADLCYRQGQDLEAKEHYFDSLALMTRESDQLFEIYKNLGNIAVREGDFEGAEEYYNKAYTLDPRSDILLVNYATLAIQQGHYEKARERFIQALEINPQCDRAWVGQALLNEQRGDVELATANVEKALDCNPKNHTALGLLARWSFQNRRFDSVKVALQNYLGEVQTDSAMSLLLAKIFIVSREEKLAIFELERLLLWEPCHEEALQLYSEIRRDLHA